MKVAILAVPLTRSSYVMARFDEAGYRLGDVDRRICEKYPAGRLELWPLANLTGGGDKVNPPPQDLWPEMDLTDVQVAKCMPAWAPILKAHGFNYWIALNRAGRMGAVRDMEYDEEMRTDGEIECPHEIWHRALNRLVERGES